MKEQISFQTVINHFQTQQQYQLFIAKAQEQYQLKIYRVNTLTKQNAVSYFYDLKDKYQKGIYQVLPSSWHQNQRRLFIWLLISFIDFSKKNKFHLQQNWNVLSQIFFKKDIKLLKYQYMSILKRSERVSWTQKQDEILMEAYKKYKKGEWNQVAKEIFFSDVSKQYKSPKHCRQRWNNHLNMKIKKDAWNEEQDYQMLKLISKYGKKWALISKLMNQKRTEHQIKNRFNSLINQTDHKDKSQAQILHQIISKLQTKIEISKFCFFNNITEIKQNSINPKPNVKIQNQRKSNTQIQQIKQKKITQDQIKNQYIQQKNQHVTSKGISIVFCGNKNQMTDPSITTIQDKLFAPISQCYSDIKSQNFWMDKSIVHTPGHYFFQDYNFEKKLNDFKFRLQSKGSFDKSQVAASMQFLRPARSQISQQIKLLSSSNSDIRTAIKYDFSSDMKQM